MFVETEKLIFEKSKAGRKGYTLPEIDVPEKKLEDLIPEKLLRKSPLNLPELNEVEVVRHFIKLSIMNYHVDRNLYPLGSCTMKYNPKINETIAGWSEFLNLHPHLPDEVIQGVLRLMKELEGYLCEVAGVDAVTLQPAAGAHGELTGMMIIRKYHEDKGNPRKYVLIPDSAHGTNPASVTLCGYVSKTIKSNSEGRIDIEDLKRNLSEEVAAIMITNPNTLGLFEKEIDKIAELIHSVGALMYLDGANLNALLGYVKPGDIGFDVVHFNLHKTFSTPHGGGGPGSGPIGVKKFLEDYLPVPRIIQENGKYKLKWDFPKSIGKVHSFYGNFNVMIKAYIYIRMMGSEGLKKVSEMAVLNANYLRSKLQDIYKLPYKDFCMHEFVLSGKGLGSVRTLDIAKRLLDYGFYAPTIYFPLIVPEALMIEPTETETKETLDKFIEAMRNIYKEAKEKPEILKNAPHKTPVRRLNDAKANRELIVSWRDLKNISK